MNARGRSAVAAASVAIAVLLLAAVAALDWLTFPLTKDEVHFWPTSLGFSRSLVPTVEQLRGYSELNTPLPFLVFGALEYLFGGGPAVARYANLLAAAAVLAMILWAPAGAPPYGRIAAALGLLLCPYFLGVATHVYTDPLAIALGLGGLVLHLRGAYVGAALAFVLAIAARQYLVAFPAALVLWEWWRTRSPLSEPRRWAWAAVAAASLGGWYLFYGGFGPQGEIHAQRIVTAGSFFLLPQNALYFLAVIGIYYVIPETVLFPGAPSLRPSFQRPRARTLLIAAGLLLLFLLFPPIENRHFPVETMGFLDKAVRLFAGDLVRMGIFYLLALLAALRFGRRLDLPALLLIMHLVLMMKAHLSWDKYALPLLAALWYLRASEPVEVTRATPERAAAQAVPA